MLDQEIINKLGKLTKKDLSLIFRVTPQAVGQWVDQGCPTVNEQGRGHALAFNLLDVIQWKLSNDESEIDPEKLSPTDRRAWYDSEQRRRDLQIKDRELIPAEELRESLSIVFNIVAQGLRSIPDNIERNLGSLDDLTFDIINKIIDSQTEELQMKLESIGS